jgi:hypothetical protein
VFQLQRLQKVTFVLGAQYSFVVVLLVMAQVDVFSGAVEMAAMEQWEAAMVVVGSGTVCLANLS